MKLILENWNKFLNESSPIDRALGKGLGLHVQADKDGGWVIVYDAKKILDAIENLKEKNPESLEPYNVMYTLEGYQKIEVLAGVVFSKSDSTKGECNNAFQVTNSASKEDSKLGPTAYEAALYYLDGLAPDRFVVKPGADKVWSIYSKRADSGDVTKDPFDDIDAGDEKKTPDDTSDDCILHKGKDHLNHSYDIEAKPSGLQELENNNVKVIAALAQLGVKQRQFFSYLENYFNSLFSSRYDSGKSSDSFWDSL